MAEGGSESLWERSGMLHHADWVLIDGVHVFPGPSLDYGGREMRDGVIAFIQNGLSRVNEEIPQFSRGNP